MASKMITIYELSGIGDDVNYLLSETDQMCDVIKRHLSENILAPGTIIEITARRVYEEDFKRFSYEA